MIFCTLLNPAIDLIYEILEFSSGHTFIDTECESIPAGKALNVAKVIHTLGEEVTVLGIVPELDINRFGRHLDDIGIKHELTPIPGVSRINTTIFEKNHTTITHLNAKGQSYPVRIQDELLENLKSKFNQGDFWCFSGSLPQGFTHDLYSNLVSSCKEKKIESFLDTRDIPLKLGLRSRPEMIKPNLSELENIFEEPIKGVHHIALKAKRLLDMGIPYVFISLGSDGMIAIHENDCLLCSPPQVNAIDTVGCGDALVAGLTVAKIRQFSFPEMCRLGIACGTCKAMHRGPGVVTRDEIWQLMEDVKITAV